VRCSLEGDTAKCFAHLACHASVHQAEPAPSPGVVDGQTVCDNAEAMRILRPSPWLSRFIVAWFALALGVISALPLSFPKTIGVVCTAGGGVKVVVANFDGKGKLTHHAVDCPLCLGAAMPLPEVPTVVSAHHQPLSHALKPATAAHIASLVGAPFPPRGPPSFA
jgi:hypothetical protein